jgi:hypothetical protein
MEIIDLQAPSDCVISQLPPIPPNLENYCNRLNSGVGMLSPVSVRYAEQWMRQGDVYYDSQTYEYRALYNHLRFVEHNTHVLLLATLPGTAIAVLPARQEWMACDLSKPGSGPAGIGFTVLKEDQRLARKPDGQSRIFQPQGSSDFGERYLFALLNIVGQDYKTVIIDATSSPEYAFHLQIALNKVTSNEGCFVWRVSSDFLIVPENQTLVARLMQEFDKVSLATLVEHDRFDTHFIIAHARRAQPIALSDKVNLALLIDRLVDYWVSLARKDYSNQMCIANYFHAANIRTSADADQHWGRYSHEFYHHQKIAQDCYIPSTRAPIAHG